jgi:hypothetical protein
MRTTLDLDDRVLSAARARAHAKGTSVGKEVSELALKALHRPAPVTMEGGFPLLPAVPGHIVTDEMVAAALED